jgi:hypothetical protein
LKEELAMAEVKANLGTKLSEQEQQSVDMTKVVRLTAQPQGDTVAGQDYMALQICPYCGCSGYGWESEYQYRYFTCHCCGRTFRA